MALMTRGYTMGVFSRAGALEPRSQVERGACSERDVSLPLPISQHGNLVELRTSGSYEDMEVKPTGLPAKWTLYGGKS